MDQLITRKELAQHFKVTERTVDKWREQGMPCIKKGRVIRINFSEAMEWIKSNKVGA